ncbi:hypothetical protein SAY86_026623 [Trapa natans]|uniref:CAAX prenyl protease 2/Lysostaphin resistance protein A-like domain-containing protein n=1 Tax=Trapa natans TaxID=22666 RepID=A0AAN7KIU9_TRANT|nr:hypothetical protein SAY86_026623 [Trapa natans]
MSERTFHSGQPHLAPRSFFGVEDFLDDDNSRPYTYQKGKKSKNPTKHISFKQRTVAYMEPFTLDVLVMKRSVSASLTHRVTSRQVAVAGTNSKDIKAVLKSRSDIPACVAVGRILAERAKEADVFTATYTPRERDKFEGKIRAVVQSIIDNDAHWATTCGTFYGSVPRIRASKEASRAYPFNGCWARTRNFSVECSAKRFRKNSKPGKGGTNDNSLDENRSVSSSDGSSLKVDRAQEDDVARLEGSAARSSAAVPSRDSVLRACVVTSGLLAALGAGIRQVSHVAFAEGLPVTDCTKEVTFGFEIWHLELVAGLVILISSSRYLLLKIWPDFAESSAAANLQVLTSLEPLDYPVVAFLPGVGEELLFRGALIPVIGLNWTSVLVVASLFGVLHLGSGRNYSFAVWATFVGFMYGWATIASGSVVAPMAAHALNNLVGGILGAVKLELRCPRSLEGISVDPDPDWSFDDLLSELSALEEKLSSSLSLLAAPFSERRSRRNASNTTNLGRSPIVFRLCISEDEMGEEEDAVDERPVSQSRFEFNELYLSEDKDDELSLEAAHPYLMDKVGLVESSLS